MRAVSGLKLLPGESEDRLYALSAEALGVPLRLIEELTITRKSLDARRKGSIHWVYSAAVRLRGEAAEPQEAYDIPALESDERPVIAGFGPAGMFAALYLARAGARPIVLEPTRRRAGPRWSASAPAGSSTCSATCSSARAAPAPSPTAS